MDEFLRSAARNIVTTVLLVIWSGLLLGLTWKVLTHLWNVLRRRLPGRAPQPVNVLFPSRPRLTVSTAPALVANDPLPALLPSPQDDLLILQLSQHKETTR